MEAALHILPDVYVLLGHITKQIPSKAAVSRTLRHNQGYAAYQMLILLADA